VIGIFRSNLYMNYISGYYSFFGINILKKVVYRNKNVIVLYCK
jgi:hypothetical protein